MLVGASVSNSLPSMSVNSYTIPKSEDLYWPGVSVRLRCPPHLRIQCRPSNYVSAVAPALVKNGLAFGRPASDEFPLISYVSVSFSDPELYVVRPSPRYWLLWPGVLIMLVYSMADIILTLVPLVRSEQDIHLLIYYES